MKKRKYGLKVHKNIRIAVKTKDMRFYYKLLNLFKGSRLRLKFYSLNQDIECHRYDLIITSEEISELQYNCQVLQVKDEHLNSELIPKILGLLVRKNASKFKRLIVGVDPGEIIGISAICDGMVLAAETSRLDQLIIKTENYLAYFPTETVVIRIGDQPISVSNVIFNKLFRAFRDDDRISIEIVQESFSSPKKTLKHAKAAVTIAQRRGIVKNHLVRNEVSRGRIREIQKWSRNRSQNRITLDEELARLVALGKISLDEAITQKEKEIEAKKNE
ncbi:MAG: hypothetical protein ACFE8U_04280 [Candidatus Hermodarchaeota archaeon]